jgi:aminotransferase
MIGLDLSQAPAGEMTVSFIMYVGGVESEFTERRFQGNRQFFSTACRFPLAYQSTRNVFMETTHSFAARRVSELTLSAIKDMAMRAARVSDVASLAWGLPSFQTPDHIRAAVGDALRRDPNAGKYTLPDGLPELREAITRQHRETIGVDISADDNVLVTAGNMEAVKCLLTTVVNPGDEVVVTDPGFASHLQQIRLSGGRPVFWPLAEKANWSLDIECLPSLITDRTRALILVTPSNPTGKVFSKVQLLEVTEILKRKGVLLILDDPYSHFVYENRSTFFSPSELADGDGNVAYLFTFSKCHAMSGWRLGYAILPGNLKQQMLKVHDATLICAPRISQIAGIAALNEEPVHLDKFEMELGRRRRMICERLDRVPHVFSYVKPEGAYYVFPKIMVPHTNATDFSIDLLQKTAVCVTPGSAFGPSGEGHVRMAFCGPSEDIEKAFDRIERHFV